MDQRFCVQHQLIRGLEMATHKVDGYAVSYRPQQNTADITLVSGTPGSYVQVAHFAGLGVTETMLMLDILRNEKPIHYDDTPLAPHIYTSFEPIGETE
jgi:hypothetical protein